MFTFISYYMILKKYKQNILKLNLFFFSMLLFHLFTFITIDLTINFPSELFHPVMLYSLSLIYTISFYYMVGIKMQNNKMKNIVLSIIIMMKLILFFISNNFLYRKYYHTSFMLIMIISLFYLVAYLLIRNQALSQKNELYLKNELINQKNLYELTKDLLDSRHLTFHKLRKEIQQLLKLYEKKEYDKMNSLMFSIYGTCANVLNVSTSCDQTFDIVRYKNQGMIKSKKIIFNATFYDGKFDLKQEDIEMLFSLLICSIIDNYQDSSVIINSTRHNNQIMLDIKIRCNKITSLLNESFIQFLEKMDITYEQTIDRDYVLTLFIDAKK